MIDLIRAVGIIPFSKCTVPGWSIQEQTDPNFWFTTSDQLGPWDWKVDAVREGIVYGKFLSRKSAFATEEIYRHLMNWRRSLPYYGMAEGGRYKATTIDARLQKHISPILLNAIRTHETLDSSELRTILEHEVPEKDRKLVGGHMMKYLLPKVTKQAVDFLTQYLEMGTWTVVGDIERVFRGPNCEYKGWQRNSITTPELLIGTAPQNSEPQPFWARFVEDSSTDALSVDCTPEESLQYILEAVSRYFPAAPAALEKLIRG